MYSSYHFLQMKKLCSEIWGHCFTNQLLNWFNKFSGQSIWNQTCSIQGSHWGKQSVHSCFSSCSSPPSSNAKWQWHLNSITLPTLLLCHLSTQIPYLTFLHQFQVVWILKWIEHQHLMGERSKEVKCCVFQGTPFPLGLSSVFLPRRHSQMEQLLWLGTFPPSLVGNAV